MNYNIAIFAIVTDRNLAAVNGTYQLFYFNGHVCFTHVRYQDGKAFASRVFGHFRPFLGWRIVPRTSCVMP